MTWFYLEVYGLRGYCSTVRLYWVRVLELDGILLGIVMGDADTRLGCVDLLVWLCGVCRRVG